MNSYDYSGKVAVVTGGANGIGAAVAERLVISGARVAIWDLDVTALEPRVAALPADSILPVTVDVSDFASVSAALENTEAGLSKVDVLINSAGIAGPTDTVAGYPPDEWRKVQAVNLDGTFHCCKAVIPAMIAGNYGRIVNVASIAGKEGNPNASAYSASKAAVIALTKSLGKETATHDIAVNCVTPATARTRILDQVTDEFIDYMLSKIPRGRFVTVEEITSMILWMASAENSFTTGAAFDLSGGRATY
ncbi:SDR family NAD(P)-dependent oxidoreductase [Hoeflea prorocentri]|uniref:SDR family NAD(P)-dependent oxidoreductase n=1 Tax=Hoeflea prorocentri TaxID=1922333 RepID=A0A9X3ZG65_9HYPH|nr:SDR family NAD(P)-dependent oxidoreductase [Hoeflea prorocentri]MCY6379486.1 SDR family NAD(P)-dependent oxidoreductase [Hoeflea prorocentri]MDA5397286.1 SDR family NAD(P)-dependent oxidoreductase [Hoeflea prorocentri]